MGYTAASYPCPSSASFKLALAVANDRGLQRYRFNVAKAYTRVFLVDEVYVRFPHPYGVKRAINAKVKWAIYGLNRSGRKDHLYADTLMAGDFSQSKAGRCIFPMMVDGVVVVVVGVNVNELLIAYSLRFATRTPRIILTRKHPS